MMFYIFLTIEAVGIIHVHIISKLLCVEGMVLWCSCVCVHVHVCLLSFFFLSHVHCGALYYSCVSK